MRDFIGLLVSIFFVAIGMMVRIETGEGIPGYLIVISTISFMSSVYFAANIVDKIAKYPYGK